MLFRSQLALLDVEERLGATDPYRQLGQLAHLILRKPYTATSALPRRRPTAARGGAPTRAITQSGRDLVSAVLVKISC